MQSINNNEFKDHQITTTTITRKYPSYRDEHFQTVYRWLAGKVLDDELDGLWRIHDTIYDFTDFIDKHPGGTSWLCLTKGTDITESFELHHISNRAENLLSKYKIREAKQPRNITLTFRDEGFYKTLKTRVREKLKNVDQTMYENKSKLIIDSLLGSMFVLGILAAIQKSLILAALCGFCLAWTTVAAHNFIHKKDNWRMMLFNLSFLSFREFRVFHAISHHMYTNSLLDMELSWFEPFFVWLPDPKRKGLFQRYASWFYGLVIYALIFKLELMKRLFYSLYKGEKTFFKEDLIPFILPTLMVLVNVSEAFEILKLWLFIVTVGSFVYSTIGLNAAHHHPEIVHPGDSFQENIDFGQYQIATIIDRSDIKGSLVLVLTNFGDHCLHHMFPTVDHAVLPLLYPILLDVCEEFETVYRECSWHHLLIGNDQQLARITPKVYDPSKRF